MLNRWTHQKVTVYGDHVGYQFSRTKNGKRTFRLTVKNVKPVVDEFGKETKAGVVYWRGREDVPVINQFCDVWKTYDPKQLEDDREFLKELFS